MSGNTITNPILRGFNPDPSICRVDDDFYIATSTFEWYPGVQIHHSRDLQNWQLVTRPLADERLLDLLGVPDSCGIWAPCLSWSDGLFWLVYTVVRRFDGDFKDTHNFVTTAPTIDGPWSDPVYLNCSGFDPSIYHAEDGRKWYQNMVWDHRPERTCFKGIALQEYDHQQQRLLGEPKLIFTGTELGYTEGPHIQKHGDFFYLITAEGGTGYGHAITIARAKSIDGPYAADPAGPLITARNHPDWPLQRTGHGDIVQLQDGSYYIVFLCSRLFPGSRHSPFGRETALQPVELTVDGWFRLPWADCLPRVEVDAPDLPEHPVVGEIERDEFDAPELNVVYQWLRTPWPGEFYSLTDRPGFLRLYGMESPGSLYKQALIARRQKHLSFTAETELDFEPVDFQQMAGLVLYYNSSKFHYLYVSTDGNVGKHIDIISCEADFSNRAAFPIRDARIRIPDATRVGLRAVIDMDVLRFEWRTGEEAWQQIPVDLDMRFLTDEAGVENGEQFTGTFAGLCANDVSGRRAAADFSYFTYRPR